MSEFSKEELEHFREFRSIVDSLSGKIPVLVGVMGFLNQVYYADGKYLLELKKDDKFNCIKNFESSLESFLKEIDWPMKINDYEG